MSFKSKVDWWFHAIAILMLILMIWLCIAAIQEKDLVLGIVGLFFILLNALLIVPIWVNTLYILDETSLLVKCGLGKPLQIRYRNISNVKETRSFLASPALSLDRLEIKFLNDKTSGIVYISPKNKTEFISLLNQRR